MPTYRHGNMWDVYYDSGSTKTQCDLFLVTGNMTIKSNGRLVMGRGIARVARDRFPELDKALGDGVRHALQARILDNDPHLTYNLLVSPYWPARRLGLFQVKDHYAADATVGQITRSCQDLADWIDHVNVHHNFNPAVHLNFPGIGAGHLPIATVKPILDDMLDPAAVTVWTFNPLQL